MAVTFSNNACSGLVDAIDEAVTAITIGPEGVFFPQLTAGDWFYGTISNDPVLTSQLPEIVKVTAIAIDVGTGDYDLTVERGAGLDGALPKSWNIAADFQLLVSSELLNDLVTGGISVAGATSWLLNSRTALASGNITVDDNGYYISASPGAIDMTLFLPEIPATGDEDIRYFINKKSLTTDGVVYIEAASGETINGYNTMDLRQQYSTVMLHATPGTTNWNATESASYDAIPDDGRIYGVQFGPVWAVDPEEAPEDGLPYCRQDAAWVRGVREAPIDGLYYVRTDGGWLDVTDEIGGGGGGTASYPTGSLTPFAGSVQPTGYLWCDGQAFARSAYAALFSVIGTTYGAPDETTFNVPDMRGRTARGLDNLGGSSDANVYPGRTSLGGVGGAYQITLTSSQMPSHTHSIGSGGSHTHTGSTGSGGAHTHTAQGQGGTINTDGSGGGAVLKQNSGSISSVGGHTHSMSLNSAGSHTHSLSSAGNGDAISQASPFVDLNWIIKL